MASPYQQIATDIADRVRRGELRPGDRVPSTRQIMTEWGVAIATATKALKELRARGVVRAIPGVGTIVADSRGEAATPLPPRHPPRTGDDMHDRIIRTAISIADGENLGAVSMRRIAIELNLPTMSLYRWIPSKEDLLVGMLDDILGQEDWPVPPKGWRAQLEYLARRQWAGYRDHPWLAQIVSLSRPQLAPRAMMHTEWALRALDGFGLDSTTRLYIVLTIFGHVKGAAAGLDAERQAERDTGIDTEAWIKESDAAFSPVIQSGRYPALARLDRDGDVEFSLESLFEFGLTVLLDGIGRLLASTTADAARTTGGSIRR
jgi:DNA-binding transcriptional regulator YhcF (GntR family)